MKVCLLVIGKTDAEFVRAGIAEYEKRLKYYIPYEMKVIPDVRNTKNMSEVQQKEGRGVDTGTIGGVGFRSFVG